ncbi:MAG: SUMF1/EgtB/PvdO family nonheme iron enzyme [Magnetococcales bacterium]|nr:SUMF1/EgtB/PvdO family nonheme iron enzyme [Magnetococcales bacterium]
MSMNEMKCKTGSARSACKRLVLASMVLLSGCASSVFQGNDPTSTNPRFALEESRTRNAPDWVSKDYEDGVHYEGQLQNGKRHGRGIQTWPDGARYEGEFQNDKRYGHGIFTWPSKERYEGAFVDGKRQGQGVYVWPNGAKFEGNYLDGQRDGAGTFTYPTDRAGKTVQERQVWNKDQLISKNLIEPLKQSVPQQQALSNTATSGSTAQPNVLRKEVKISQPTTTAPPPAADKSSLVAPPGTGNPLLSQPNPTPGPTPPVPPQTTSPTTVAPSTVTQADISRTTLWTDPQTGIILASIPGGCFIMGNDKGEKNEKPAHEVCVDDFWMGIHEITQKQWRQVMGWLPEQSIAADNLPVGNISWLDVERFVTMINKRSAVQFRIPTEAQWEYACSGGGQSKPYCGDGKVEELGWVEENAKNQPHPPGERTPNRFGLYDMTGNLWEWVADWYDREYYRDSPKQNPKGPTVGSSRTFRGGGWLTQGEFARATIRQDMDPTRSYPLLGFRLAAPRVMSMQ